MIGDGSSFETRLGSLTIFCTVLTPAVTLERSTANLETTGPYTRTVDRSGAPRIRGPKQYASNRANVVRFLKHRAYIQEFEALNASVQGGR